MDSSKFQKYISDLQESIVSKEKSIEKAAKVIEQLKLDLDKVIKELSKSEQEKSQLQKDFKILEKEYALIKKEQFKMESLQKQEEKSLKSLQAYKERITVLQNELIQKETQKKTEDELYANELANLNQILQNKNEEIKCLIYQIQEQNEQLKITSQNLSIKEQSISKLENEVKILQLSQTQTKENYNKEIDTLKNLTLSLIDQDRQVEENQKLKTKQEGPTQKFTQYKQQMSKNFSNWDQTNAITESLTFRKNQLQNQDQIFQQILNQRNAMTNVLQTIQDTAALKEFQKQFDQSVELVLEGCLYIDQFIIERDNILTLLKDYQQAYQYSRENYISLKNSVDMILMEIQVAYSPSNEVKWLIEKNQLEDNQNKELIEQFKLILLQSDNRIMDETLKKENQQLKQEIKSLKKEKLQISKENQTNQKEIQQSARLKENQQFQEYDQLRNENQQLSGQIQQLKNDNQFLITQFDTLNEQNSKTFELLQQSLSELENLENKLQVQQQQQEQVNALQQIVDAQQDSYKLLESQIVSKELQIEQLKNQNKEILNSNYEIENNYLKLKKEFIEISQSQEKLLDDLSLTYLQKESKLDNSTEEAINLLCKMVPDNIVSTKENYKQDVLRKVKQLQSIIQLIICDYIEHFNKQIPNFSQISLQYWNLFEQFEKEIYKLKNPKRNSQDFPSLRERLQNLEHLFNQLNQKFINLTQPFKYIPPKIQKVL